MRRVGENLRFCGLLNERKSNSASASICWRRAAASQENGGSSAKKTQIDVAAGRDRGRFDVMQAKLVRGAPKENNEMKCACIELVELLESMRLTDLRLPTSSILRLKYIWSLVAKWAAGFLLAPRTLLPASQHQ